MNLFVWKIHSDSLEVEKEVKASITIADTQGAGFPQPLTRRLSLGGRGVAPERSKADEEEESLYSRFSVRRGLPQSDRKRSELVERPGTTERWQSILDGEFW